MGHDPLAVANYFVQKSDGKMTLMKVIKLSYISHGFCLAILNQPLLNEEPQAWKFGPIFPTMYHGLKIEIGLIKKDCDKLKKFENYNDFQNSETKIMDKVIAEYGALGGWELSILIHDKDTPWRKSWDKNKGSSDIVIPNQEIKKYYKTASSKRLQ